jgi:hypothetical protein
MKKILAEAADVGAVTVRTLAARPRDDMFYFYEELNAVIQEEPADAFNPELVGLCASIGIRKGQPFAPDARMKEILTEAVALGNATARAITFAPRNKSVYFYPDRQWYSPFAGGSHKLMNIDIASARMLCG